jgi:hypothetical protein
MPTQKVDWSNLLFLDPDAAVRRIKAEAVAEARGVLHSDYDQLTNRQRWEQMFYEGAPHLRPHRELVEEAMVSVAKRVPSNTPVACLSPLFRRNCVR